MTEEELSKFKENFYAELRAFSQDIPSFLCYEKYSGFTQENICELYKLIRLEQFCREFHVEDVDKLISFLSAR